MALIWRAINMQNLTSKLNEKELKLIQPSILSYQLKHINPAQLSERIAHYIGIKKFKSLNL
jgi:hypothetical protein